ncbi:hypothetical protein RCL1_003666 [Eukaryota sp. TZLM3-RCL]
MFISLQMLRVKTMYLFPLEEHEIRFGFRRLIVRPLFSEVVNGAEKLKFVKKILPGNGYIVSFYGPLMFAPLPVILYKQSKMIGHGGIWSCNPDTIILQKVIIAGYPMKIHKSVATIRYMFFNRDDINFYKPIRLWTRDGKQGNIIGPIGTHGLLKAKFSATLKSSDTVCMSLFKRVYPAFDTKFISLLPDPLNQESDVYEEIYCPMGLNYSTKPQEIESFME